MKAPPRLLFPWVRFLAAALFLFGGLFPAFAHKLSDGYLALAVTHQRLAGRLEISLHDFEQSIGLDADADGEVTWGEVQRRETEIKAYVQARTTAEVDGVPVELQVESLQINQRGDGGYVVVSLVSAAWTNGRVLSLGYGLMFDVDPLHLGLLKLEMDGTARTGIFAADRRTLVFSFDEEGSNPFGQAFAQFVREGVWHIWIGLDHILFLVALLLPAVFTVHGNRWEPTRAFRPALVNVLKVVTAFTVAHSITLSLAVLDVVHLPSRLVESTIAASVVVAAANNLKPFFRDRGWVVAFAFGLIHGFGFAGVLAELELPARSLAAGLVGFNLGVELGQLAMVAVFLPVAFLLRVTPVYRRGAVQFGSVVIGVVAGLWCVERIFDLGFMPF